MENYKWHTGFTLVAAGFLASHLFWPNLKIDSIALVLLAACFMPWLGKIFESLEMPGGWKFKYKDFEKAATLAVASGLVEPTTQDVTDQAHFALLDTDPQLAVIGLRIDIEKRLRKIADKNQLPGLKLSSLSLTRQMEKLGILTGPECVALLGILVSLNSVVHGATITRPKAEQVLEVGKRLIESLDNRL